MAKTARKPPRLNTALTALKVVNKRGLPPGCRLIIHTDGTAEVVRDEAEKSSDEPGGLKDLI